MSFTRGAYYSSKGRTVLHTNVLSIFKRAYYPSNWNILSFKRAQTLQTGANPSNWRKPFKLLTLTPSSLPPYLQQFNFMKGCYLLPIKAAEAESYLEKAIKLHSNAPTEYWNRLAECLWIQGKVRRWL